MNKRFISHNLCYILGKMTVLYKKLQIFEFWGNYIFKKKVIFKGLLLLILM